MSLLNPFIFRTHWEESNNSFQWIFYIHQKTINSSSVYALHILRNRREYGTVHSRVELIKPCGKKRWKIVLLRDLYSAFPPKESSHCHANSSRSQPTQLPVTCGKTDTRGTYTNRTRHSAWQQTSIPLGVYTNHASCRLTVIRSSIILMISHK